MWPPLCAIQIHVHICVRINDRGQLFANWLRTRNSTWTRRHGTQRMEAKEHEIKSTTIKANKCNKAIYQFTPYCCGLLFVVRSVDQRSEQLMAPRLDKISTSFKITIMINRIFCSLQSAYMDDVTTLEYSVGETNLQFDRIMTDCINLIASAQS